MDDYLNTTIYHLQKLQQHLLNAQFKNVFIVLGNKKAGKKTLIHYMMQSDIIFELDQDGQDVLTIQNQADKIVIIQNLIQIIPCPPKQSLFIKIEGFINSSKSQQQKIQWSLTFDTLLSLLTLRNVYVKFILIFSSQQLQEDDELFINYFKSLKNVNNFVKRTHLVMSKVVDQQQINQFTQITVQNIKQSHQNCQFLDQIIQQERLIGFYCRQVDQVQRNQLNSKIVENQVDPTLKLTYQGAVTHQILHGETSDQRDLHGIYQKHFNQLKITLSLINYSIIQILFKGLKVNKDQYVSKGFKQSWKKIYQENKQFQSKNSITQKKNIEQFMKNYQQLVKKSKIAPQQLLDQIFNKINFIISFYPQQIIKKGVLTHTKILIILCKASSQKDPEQLFKNQDLINIFINHENGCFQDHYLVKTFQKAKPYLSAQFAKGYQKMASTPIKKKVIKKVKPKNVVPNFEQQKKAYLAKYKNPEQIQNLLVSPLKLDLLIQNLERIRSNKTRNIFQQKKTIKNIYKILQVYGCFQQAARFSWVLPNNYLVSYYLIKHIKKLNLSEKEMSSKNCQLIESVCKYFMIVLRPEYVNSVLNQLLKIEQQTPQQKRPLIQKNISKIKQKLQKIKGQPAVMTQQQRKQQIVKSFMNYSHVSGVIKNKKQLIQACINQEAKNSPIIQLDAAIKWMLTGAEFKVTLE